MHGAHQLILRSRSSRIAHFDTSTSCNDKGRRYISRSRVLLQKTTWKSSPGTLVRIVMQLLRTVLGFERIFSQFTVIFRKRKYWRYWKVKNKTSADIIEITLEIWKTTYLEISILEYLVFGKSHVQLFSQFIQVIVGFFQVRALSFFPASFSPLY